MEVITSSWLAMVSASVPVGAPLMFEIEMRSPTTMFSDPPAKISSVKTFVELSYITVTFGIVAKSDLSPVARFRIFERCLTGEVAEFVVGSKATPSSSEPFREKSIQIFARDPNGSASSEGSFG